VLLDNAPPSADYEAIRARVVVLDGDGRIHRLIGGTAALTGAGQRIVVPLQATVDGIELRPSYPLSVVGVELELLPGRWALGGVVDLVSIEMSAAAAGDDWSNVDLAPGAAGWSWLRATDSQPPARYDPPAGRPWQIDAEAAVPGFGDTPLFGPTTFRLLTGRDEAAPIAAIAGRQFLTATAARVGETVGITVRGTRLEVRIDGVVETFPPVDPQQPFLVVDAAALDLARFGEVGQAIAAKEWWLSVEDGKEPDVLAVLGARSYGAEAVTGRKALETRLSTEPVSLGVIGVLGLGGIAALVFAGIGFVVSATVSAAERIGEFALLRALGLSGRQLSIWLSLESAFLLVVGLVAGSALGLLLAWLVLPFATLTQTGSVPIPMPVVVVPWQALLPVWVLALVLLAITAVIVRRQLPAMKISGVLRAHDE
jgi:hypothetical protein